MDLYQRLATSAENAQGCSETASGRTQETKAIETRDGDMQATLLRVDAP